MLPFSFRSFWVRQILFPMEDHLRGIPINRYYNFYRSNQWSTREKIRASQDKALSLLIQHAYQTVPFYRRRMQEAGIKPQDIRSVEELKFLPYLTRKDVIENIGDLTSSIYSPRELIKGSSSGSTGQVVISYHTKKSVGSDFGAERIGWEIGGYRFGSRRVMVWGNRLTVEEQWSRLGSRIKQWAYQSMRIGAYRLTDDKQVRQALEKIKQFSPDYLWGYPNAIYFLALKAKQFGISDLKCKGVLTTAETVYDFQRDSIQEMFGPVKDGYGSGEIPGVAYECEESGLYHVIDPRVIVEYDSCGDNQFLELVLTDLVNYGMPFIRYKVGDLAIPSSERCSCGRQWSTLKRIVGRTSDLVITPAGGALLVPSFFGSSLISQLPKIHQYQIAKVSPTKIIIRLESNPPLSDSEVDYISQQLAPYLKGKIDYEISQVEHIILTQAGKFKLMVDETKTDL